MFIVKKVNGSKEKHEFILNNKKFIAKIVLSGVCFGVAIGISIGIMIVHTFS